ncbi:MAG: DoxX family protein [Thermoanaerobaculia bacterium]
MTTALWIAQGFAALVFVLTGTLKLVTPKEKLVGKMHWAATWPPGRIKLLGFAEVAGAIGLVLPAALHIAPVLTPIAAVCLAVLMAGAIQTHRRFHENFVPALVLALVCVAIAAGRTSLMG